MNKIDPKLIFELGVNVSFTQESDLLDLTAELNITKKAGMFIRVKNCDWQPPDNIQDYTETSRFKRSIGCIGSCRTIKSLQNDPGVVYVEGNCTFNQE